MHGLRPRAGPGHVETVSARLRSEPAADIDPVMKLRPLALEASPEVLVSYHWSTQTPSTSSPTGFSNVDDAESRPPDVQPLGILASSEYAPAPNATNASDPPTIAMFFMKCWN